MGITNLGAVGITAGGVYNSETVYKKYKVVSANGGSYMYINPTPAAGVPVTDTSHWQQIASRGQMGPFPVYANLAALTSADPDRRFVYITKDTGKWYSYDDGWVEGGNFTDTEQTTEILSQIERVANNPSLPPEAMITFAFDDGFTEDLTFAAPVLHAKGYSGVSAIITGSLSDSPTSYMTNSQVIDLQNTYGWEIASHGIAHTHFPDVSPTTVESELTSSKATLEALLGVSVETLVYPYGEYNDTVIELARKHYKQALSTEGGYNGSPVNTYALKRMGFGGRASNDVLLPLSYYTGMVDTAIAKKSWLIFTLHGFNFKGEDGPDNMATFEGLVNYISGTSARVVTIREGMEIKRNIVDIGHFGNGHFLVGHDGGIDSTATNPLIYKKGPLNVTIDTPISAFEPGMISANTFVNADASGFPGDAGHLVTYRLSTVYEGTNFQLWFPRSTPHKIYRRQWPDSGTDWGQFHIFETGNSLGFIKGDKTGINFSSPITAFKSGAMTITTFLTADASGFPGGAGTLETHRFSSADVVNYQIWYPRGDKHIYRRNWNETDWASLGMFSISILGEVTLPGLSVPANSMVDEEVDFEGAVKNNGTMTATPLYGIPAGLMWTCFCNTTGKATIRVFNATGAPVTRQAKWRISIVL